MCRPKQNRKHKKKSTTTSRPVRPHRHDDDRKESFAWQTWQKFKHVSSFAFYSPFFLRLASNTLATPTFVTFALQERHFLTAFAHAYEVVAPYAVDDECKAALLGLRKFALDRLRGHDAVMQVVWGFNMPVEGASYEASPAATKYKNFLLETAAGRLLGDRGRRNRYVSPYEKTKVPAYAVAAVAPFMRLWVFIASEIKAVLDPDDKGNPYCKWLDNTSCRGFQARASEREDMLDRLCFHLPRDELETVERVYHHALKLLVEFIFDSALPIPQRDVSPVSRVLDFNNRQLTIFCDFDKACAVHDSSDTLAKIFIRNVSRSKSQGSLDQLSSADIKSHASETQLDQLSSEDIKSHASETQLDQLSSEDIKSHASETQLDQLCSEDIKSQASEIQLDPWSSADIKSHASETQLDQLSSEDIKSDASETQLYQLCSEDIKSQASETQLDLLSSADIKSQASETHLDPLSLAVIKSHGSETQPVQLSSADIKSSWDIMSARYTEEFEQCVETILASEKAEAFHYEDLRSALEQVGDFERNAIERVVRSGILKGLRVLDIKQAGLQALLHDGCRSFFQRILNNKNLRTDVHIISYCWCDDFITSAISPEGNINDLIVHSNQLADEELIINADLNDSSVCSNELADENLTTAGHLNDSRHSNESANEELIATGDLSDSIVHSNKLVNKESVSTDDRSDLIVQSDEWASGDTITTGNINDSTAHSNKSTYEDLDGSIVHCHEYSRDLSESTIPSKKSSDEDLDGLVYHSHEHTSDRSDSTVLSNELASEETITTENLSDLTVHPNKLPNVELVTTGEIIRKVESPWEKLQVFYREKDNSHVSIYIGGSVGDFLCLLQADIGIVTGEGSALRRIGDHFGVTFAPLFPALVKKQRQVAATKEGSFLWKPMSGTLYTVTNWAEIHAFILGATSLTDQKRNSRK